MASLSLALMGCDGVSSDPGLEAYLRAEGAMYRRGPMPGETLDLDAPAVDLSSNQIEAGEVNKPLRGALDPRATAALIGLQGDLGHWVIPAGVPGVEAPAFPTFATALSFSLDLPSGPQTLLVRAVNAHDGVGPPSVHVLQAQGATLPDGALVISLRWDRDADLDLHVIDPFGVEIDKSNINSVPPPMPGMPVDPNAWEQGGILDADANAGCVIDGRRQENVVWSDARPAGLYVVRVDTFSLCGEPSARWLVDVRANGALLARAAGESLPSDEWFDHGRGAGARAVSFDLP